MTNFRDPARYHGCYRLKMVAEQAVAFPVANGIVTRTGASKQKMIHGYAGLRVASLYSVNAGRPGVVRGHLAGDIVSLSTASPGRVCRLTCGGAPCLETARHSLVDAAESEVAAGGAVGEQRMERRTVMYHQSNRMAAWC